MSWVSSGLLSNVSVSFIEAGALFKGGVDTSGSNNTVLGDVNSGIATNANDIVLANVTGTGYVVAVGNSFDVPQGGNITITNADVQLVYLLGGTDGVVTINGTLSSATNLVVYADKGLTVNANATLNGTVQSFNGSVSGLSDQDYRGNVVLSGDLELRGNTASFSGGLQGQGYKLDSNLAFSRLDESQPITNVSSYIARGEAGLNGTTSFGDGVTFNGNVTLLGDAGITAATSGSGFL